ncbi:hypothetical protein BBJ28_00000113 [Nothophytophthora sp. Chile5]|nr:hypothetical protein BBJ28_00000113 [Nothophytophthora sp. Chile5]
MRSVNERGPLLRCLALLAFAVAFGAAQPAGEGDDPVKFGPVPSLPTRVEPYEPHEVQRSEERPQQTFGLSLAALVVLVAAGGKIGGGGVLDAVYLLVLKLQPDQSRDGDTTGSTIFQLPVSSFNFFLWGKLDLSLAQLTLPVGFVMTLLGRVCLVKIVRKAKFRTLLFFAIAAALLVSIVPLSFQEIRSMLGA